MEIVIVLAFVGLMLVVAMLLFFAVLMKQRDFDHTDRLALLPLRDDAIGASAPPLVVDHVQTRTLATSSTPATQ